MDDRAGRGQPNGSNDSAPGTLDPPTVFPQRFSSWVESRPSPPFRLTWCPGYGPSTHSPPKPSWSSFYCCPPPDPSLVPAHLRPSPTSIPKSGLILFQLHRCRNEHLSSLPARIGSIPSSSAPHSLEFASCHRFSQARGASPGLFAYSVPRAVIRPIGANVPACDWTPDDLDDCLKRRTRLVIIASPYSR